MVQYKLLACLLVGSLLTIKWRVSNTRTVTASVPQSADPDAILKSLHDQVGFIRMNPVITSINQVPTEPAINEDDWFSTAESHDPIETYMLTSKIVIIPGTGSWGEKQIQFGTWLRNTKTGVKTKADAPFGVSVRSHWTVLKGSSELWELTVERTVECFWWVLPFVAYTYDDVHASVIRDLITAAEVTNA
ncbi:hypothetical protein BDV12DRAFT_15283 [Aspergillus spectabilis]